MLFQKADGQAIKSVRLDVGHQQAMGSCRQFPESEEGAVGGGQDPCRRPFCNR